MPVCQPSPIMVYNQENKISLILKEYETTNFRTIMCIFRP